MTSKKVNELASEIHQIAVEKGWWDKERNEQEIFMLIITELAEAVEADREDRRANLEKFKRFKDRLTNNDAHKANFEGSIKDTIEDELADAFIRCLDYMYFVSDMAEIRLVDVSWNDNFAENIFFLCKVMANEDIPTTAGLITSLADHMDIDLQWHVEQKMLYNTMRSRKHGGKKY